MRCQHPDCKKKLSFLQQECNTCRCQKKFCDRHRLPETHPCSVDHMITGKETLKKTLVDAIPDKVIFI